MININLTELSKKYIKNYLKTIYPNGASTKEIHDYLLVTYRNNFIASLVADNKIFQSANGAIKSLASEYLIVKISVVQNTNFSHKPS